MSDYYLVMDRGVYWVRRASDNREVFGSVDLQSARFQLDLLRRGVID